MAAKKRTATKRAAGKSTREKPAPASAEKSGQKAYLAKRDEAIEKLFLLEGLDAVDITERLVANKTIETKDETGESALRLVRSVIAKIRARIDRDRDGDAQDTVAPNEFDAISRRLNRLRREYIRQVTIAEGELTEMCARTNSPLEACTGELCELKGGHVPYTGPAVGTTTTLTPQGPMVAYRALWPAGVRQKASRDAAKLAEQIAELELEIATKRSAQKLAADDINDGGLLIIESDKSIEELIEQNLRVN